MTENKSYKVQVLRGLAITAVVLAHNTPDGLPQVWFRPFFNFPVGLFLFLSGMLSSAENWHPGKRIKKVAIPYVLWTFIYVVILYYKDPAHIPIAFAKNLLVAGAAAVMYYVFVYSELTLLIPLIDRLARSKCSWIGLVITPLEIICMRLIPLMTGYKFSTPVRLIMNISCLGWFSFYYLGYLVGNGFLKIKAPVSRILFMWMVSIPLQMLEGYWYYTMGASNYGTSLKLTSVLSAVLVIFLADRYLNSENTPKPKILYDLGDISFGIFFSHLAVMLILDRLPYYKRFVVFPLNAIVALIVTSLCVIIGRKVLGKYAKYLAF